MAIDKPLYPRNRNPDIEEIQLEVEIEDAPDDPDGPIEIIELEDGSVEVTLGDGSETDNFADLDFNANLAEYMEDDALGKLAISLMEDVDGDIIGRKDWVDIYIKGLNVIGMKYEERTEPWENACGVHSTLLSEAVIRFQAETMSETFPPTGLVKTKIIGKETKEKLESAERVRVDMNYQLSERMTEYRPEHEKLLWGLGLAGAAFKKIYKDELLGRATAPFVAAEDIIIPFGCSNVEQAERVTHVMRKSENDLAKLMDSGFYRDVELAEPVSYHSDVETAKAKDAGFELSEDKRYAFYEIHVDTVIEPFDDETDLAKPYVITIEKDSNEILAIRRNWKEQDPLKLKRQHFVQYNYIPGFGSYGMGLIHIIGGYAMAGTSLIRQLVDSGTLSNLPGGFKSTDLRVVKGNGDPIGPGDWVDVETPSGNIRDSLLPLPYKEPSATLLALLDKITAEGRRLGAISDMDVSDMSANAPVGTTLALLERTLKPMAAVQSRVHYSMKQEFKLLKAIIAQDANAGDGYDYQPETGEIAAKQQDYAVVDVIPVSDPNSTTMAQRVVQYQAALDMATRAPEIYDLPFLHRQMLDVIGIKNADKLVPLSEDAEPQDPVSENMGSLVGTPMKAFIYQDHESHIGAHMAFIQDPMIAQTIGQNPQAQQIMAAMQAHIAEHLGFAYRSKIEEKLGVTLPPPGSPLPEELEVLLSRTVADAGKQLTQQHQQEAAQKEAAQAAQDPALQIKQEAEKTKRMEVERKVEKDKSENQWKGDEQNRKRTKDQVDARLSVEEIAEQRRATQVDAALANIKLQDERKELDRRLQLEKLQAVLGTRPAQKPESE